MSPLLEARQLSKRYQEGSITVAAVDSVSFAVDQGQIALIIGPSGSGKSTLLSMLGCILRPTSGAVLLAGHEVSGLSDRDLPIIRGKYFGFVFQAFHLFPFLTAQENVETALRLRKIPSSARRARSIDFLTRCGLDQRMSFYPASLSGGEKQRVAIARTILKAPPILVLDEATSALDSFTESEIQTALDLVAKGRTTLMIAHRLSTIVHADEILVLDKGEIVERGAHASLLAQNGVYAALWKRQNEVRQAEETLRRAAVEEGGRLSIVIETEGSPEAEDEPEGDVEPTKDPAMPEIL
jgi:ABC-type multidrug transport system fused ATPase/permease subunit